MDLRELNLLSEKRRAIGHLLSPDDPADALASYYAFWHDPRRVQLTLYAASAKAIVDPPARSEPHIKGSSDGFVVVAQTGADLFRPLVTLRAAGAEAVASLLRAALGPGRAYYLIVPARLGPWVRELVALEHPALNRILRLDPSRFQPVLNVLVQRVDTDGGSTHFRIQSGGQVVAMAGTNWRSPTFAEVFVYVHPSGRGRGWGRSVVSACTAALLEQGLQPLYAVEEANEASIHIAESLGYVDTGARDLVGEVVLLQ